MSDGRPLVLILGAGINGCSLARELVLNGVDVWIVDSADVASGATSRSSRLIHGGLRYLEYGDFHLVRESLAERRRLASLAPHLVAPLRLYVPVSRRTSGLFQSAWRFFGVERHAWLARLTRPLRRRAERGLWVVRIGLRLYDRFASDAATPRSSVHRLSDPGVPPLDPRRYRWVCAYSDAQMRYPERYCVALLHDAREVAAETNVEFRLLTYARAEFVDSSVSITTAGGDVETCRPAVAINATGAWGDRTLESLHVAAPRLFGGTKGSHLVTHHAPLRQAIGKAGIYAEADDGRLIFVLPFGDAVLVGTTDERFEDSPARAVASEHEVDYLVSTVNELFPDMKLARSDITLTYSGVRPLPYTAAEAEASISRDHFVAASEHAGIPVLTLVGGKLTTARAFGELVADDVFRRLSITRRALTVGRPIPGWTRAPAPPPGRPGDAAEPAGAAARIGPSGEQFRAMRELVGDRVEAVLSAGSSRPPHDDDAQSVAGTSLPRGFVRGVIQTEWVSRVEDLVERRLMLLYAPVLSRRTLEELAELMVECGRLDAAQRDESVEVACRRLASIYSRTVTD
jgi:glycerol-3-phosphate dehydrogenase